MTDEEAQPYAAEMRAKRFLTHLIQNAHTLSEADLATYKLAAMQHILESGQGNPYDPDSDPADIDDPDSEYASVTEWIYTKALDLIEVEIKRRQMSLET